MLRAVSDHHWQLILSPKTAVHIRTSQWRLWARVIAGKRPISLLLQ